MAKLTAAQREVMAALVADIEGYRRCLIDHPDQQPVIDALVKALEATTGGES